MDATATAELTQDALERILTGLSGATYVTREEWLTAAKAELMARTPWGRWTNAHTDTCVVSAGFPKTRAQSAKLKKADVVMGDRTADGKSHIYVHPSVADPIECIAMVGHEILRVSAQTEKYDDPHLKNAIYQAGFRTARGYDLSEEGRGLSAYAAIAAKLGPYPVGAANVVKERTPAKTRLLKANCQRHDYTVRIAQTPAENIGAPVCPACLDYGYSRSNASMIVTDGEGNQIA